MSRFCKQICENHPDVIKYAGGRTATEEERFRYEKDGVKRCNAGCQKFFQNQQGKRYCFCCGYPLRIHQRRGYNQKKRSETVKRIE